MSSNKLDNLLARLDKVRDKGNGQYTACCPAHDDRSPSLAVRETDDGTILIKCWAGCGAADVVAAVGMELSDLFPDSAGSDTLRLTPQRKRFSNDMMAQMVEQILVVAIVGEKIGRGEPLRDIDRQCALESAYDLYAAAQYLEGF